MQPNQKGSISYLLRLWRNTELSDSVWRASLENPMTGERKGFASIDELANFLKSVTVKLDIEAKKIIDEENLLHE
ncbi:MAG: hypothetical protein MUO77_20170 [Anaerolineales bacterium]|nr:hypothetical protein [Anaerolineales bacterium]